MTTTDIHNWKGIEFSKEFVDFTVTGMLEAKATGSVQTGRMVRSIKMKKILDGFSVYSDRSDFPPTRRGKDRYYTHVYHERGYPRYPAFPFIFIAFDTVGESEQLVNSTSGFFNKGLEQLPDILEEEELELLDTILVIQLVLGNT